MKFLAFYIIFLFLFILNISVKTKEKEEKKIDLFNYNIVQEFDVSEEEIQKELNRFENNIKDDKYVNKLKKKGVDFKNIKGILEKYSDIKKKKDPKKKSEKNKSDSLNNIKQITPNSKINTLNKEPLNKEKLKLQEKIIQEENTKFKSISHNIIVSDKNLIKKTSGQKSYVNKELQNSNMIPVEECNINWDYTLNGDDWMCMCQSGKSQSPINIIPDIKLNPLSSSSNLKFKSEKNKKIIFFNKIFCDFKDPELSCSNSENEACKFPLIKNTGTDLIIEDDCGVLVMPPHMNGYKCFKIELHSPAEHKIDSKSFELEIQIYFKLEDKRIVDNTTTDYLVLVILFKGINEDNVQEFNLSDGVIADHPFLNLLELDRLPNKKGHARLLTNFLNFNLLFDESLQLIKRNNLNKSNNEMVIEKENRFLENSSNEVDSRVSKAINDLTYDKNHPLNEFYIYNGSLNKPPCDENVQYIVVPNNLFAPMEQIIKISQAIIQSGNKTGNFRNIQSNEDRNIFYYKNNNNLTNKIKDLKLDEEHKNKINNEGDDEDLEDAENNQEQTNSDGSDKLIDKILNSKQSSLSNILALSKLR